MAETTSVQHCERHGEATRLTCVDCDTPVCPKCMVRTDVGLKCEDCAQPAAPTPKVRPSRLRRPVLLMLVGVVVVLVPLLFVVGRGDEDTPLTGRSPAGPPVGEWTSWPDLSGIRGTATTTVLEDGRVLVAGGGVGNIPVASAELIDPASGESSATGELNIARRGARAVLLDDGRVLVSGGFAEGDLLASTEVYDPAAGTWAEVAAMATGRLGHTLTLLPDGRVLATGGSTPGAEEVAVGGQTVTPDDSVEVYDPATDTWSEAGNLSSPRFEHTATAIDGGKVLVLGGTGPEGVLSSAEIYDPAASVATGAGNLNRARTNHAAARMADGRVFVAGGAGGANGDQSLTSAEIFDPRRGVWTTIESMRQSRTGLTATVLDDGRVLVAGGEARTGGTRRSLSSAELYVPDQERWDSAGAMACPRSEHDAVLLDDGRVVAVAGDAASPGEATVHQGCLDVYTPG